MDKRHFITAGLALLLSVSGAVLPMNAANAQGMQNNYSAGQARDARDSGNVIPAVRAISIVRGRYPGAEVLNAQLQGGSSPQYVVTILTREGRRVNVIVDARTGQVIGER
ncbi:PepSY domain-containing protein [Hyphobacterium sp.]|uniref:PepSY domain-containing protein n=1 Tax=Hyphobacterium sp. TaxID=2004662 RepID=UPI003748A20F